MASIIALGIVLAFIIFGALERLAPKAGKFLGALSGIAFTLLACWGIFLGISWGLQEIGISTDQLAAYFNTTSWVPAF
jgi:hypothetical protein